MRSAAPSAFVRARCIWLIASHGMGVRSSATSLPSKRPHFFLTLSPPAGIAWQWQAVGAGSNGTADDNDLLGFELFDVLDDSHCFADSAFLLHEPVLARLPLGMRADPPALISPAFSRSSIPTTSGSYCSSFGTSKAVAAAPLPPFSWRQTPRASLSQPTAAKRRACTCTSAPCSCGGLPHIYEEEAELLSDIFAARPPCKVRRSWSGLQPAAFGSDDQRSAQACVAACTAPPAAPSRAAAAATAVKVLTPPQPPLEDPTTPQCKASGLMTARDHEASAGDDHELECSEGSTACWWSEVGAESAPRHRGGTERE